MTPFHLRKITKLSFPVMTAFFSYHILGIIDVLMVGNLGTQAVAAVGVAVTASFFLVGPLEGFLDASTIRMSQAWGREERQAFLLALKEGLWWALVAGVASVVLAWPLGFCLPLFAPDSQVVALAWTYLMILALSWIPQFLAMVCTRYFLSRQKNGVVALVSNLTVALNVVFNFLFIFGVGDWKGWGVAGSAAGTLVARLFQLGLLAVLIHRDSRKQGWRFRSLKLDKGGLGRFARQGFPLAQSNFVEFAAWFLFVAFIGQLGTAAMAAHAISMKIKDLGYIFGRALATVGTTLVGQAVGAGQGALAKRWAQGTALVAMGIMGSFALVFLLFPEFLLGFFTHDRAVLVLAVPLLRLMALYQVVDAVYVSYRSALTGLGEVRYVRNVAFLGGWLIMAGGAFLFTKVWPLGLMGAWFSLTLFVLLASVLYYRRFNGRVLGISSQGKGKEWEPSPLGAEDKT